VAIKHKLNIISLGAYILKVQRSGIKLTEYKDQFRQIRHGHYDEFLKSVRILFPDKKIEDAIKVKYDSGKIRVSNFSQKEGCDFEGLLNAESGVATLGNHIYRVYGKASDPEFTTNLLECVIEFELGFRNALCNELMKREIDHNFINELKVEIEDIITLVCLFKEVTNQDKEVFQTGRKFINYVKHKNLRGFENVEDGVKKFSEAFDLSTAHGFILI